MEHSFKLTIQYAAGNAASAALPTRTQFRRWVKSALEQEAEIVIRIVDKFEGRTLNHDYRGKDYATNVLTFVYDDTEPLSGDVVLCAEVIENEARQQHKTLMAHYAHLTVHGLLHLQGYDHVSDDEATIMEKKETDILIRLGFNDPYAISCEALISS
ncbi:MAG TPA: rRNA maturation RNase YbeY [Nitrosomonas sp.]|nr:rRNA maturation RNase YbeY [Nitrosomonas sp.]HNP25654.1 rRNA maturation RNase YbeY [Nitrosomonas sp.]